MDWWNLMKQSVTVGAQLLWSGRYGCNNGRHGCTIVMSYIEINKAVSQWLLTFNLCVSVTWPLTCAFHIPCTHTPEIIDMHRGMCDNCATHTCQCNPPTLSYWSIYIYFLENLILLDKIFTTPPPIIAEIILGSSRPISWFVPNRRGTIYMSN